MKKPKKKRRPVCPSCGERRGLGFQCNKCTFQVNAFKTMHKIRTDHSRDVHINFIEAVCYTSNEATDNLLKKFPDAVYRWLQTQTRTK